MFLERFKDINILIKRKRHPRYGSGGDRHDSPATTPLKRMKALIEQSIGPGICDFCKKYKLERVKVESTSLGYSGEYCYNHAKKAKALMKVKIADIKAERIERTIGAAKGIDAIFYLVGMSVKNK